MSPHEMPVPDEKAGEMDIKKIPRTYERGDGKCVRSSAIRGRIYLAKPFTNSTTLRSAIPDGPLAIHGF